MVAALTVLLLRWGIHRVPVGVRSFVGILLMVAGVFWFLPLVGFWMLPLGVAFVGLDIPWTRRHIHDWMERLEKAGRARKIGFGPTVWITDLPATNASPRANASNRTFLGVFSSILVS